MSQSPEFSLIVATAGRTAELDLLLSSLVKQQSGTDNFEVIICDQNPPGYLEAVLARYRQSLSLVHLYSERKSLSYSRNKGIAEAQGKFLTFPDDDCQYYPDTIQVMHNQLQRENEIDLLIGTVYDRQQQKYVFKKTPAQSTLVTKYNFHAFVSSIALVVRNNNIRFDENFGIGEAYHSNEDADLLLSCIEKKFKLLYIPELQFCHPPYDARNMSVEKLGRYGIGFGALVRKHLSPVLLYLFIKVLVFQVLMMAKALFSFNLTELQRRKAALSGRIKGFFIFKKSAL